MFVSDLRSSFYDVIVTCGDRVLLLVGNDVDGLCACSILRCLFACDNVAYTLVPVHDKQSLRGAYDAHAEQIKRVVLINCGATIDLVEFLEAKDDVVFYVVDSHRPYSVYNVYSAQQVCILGKENPDDGIPPLDSVFREDDSDDEDDGQFTEEQLERRRGRREWLSNRSRILFEYNQFSFYGNSSAVAMFELSWKVSKDTNQLLWWAIVGLAEQYLRGKVEHDRYVLDVGAIQGHVARHNHQGSDLSVDCLRITFDTELQLSMYRHWTLIDSLRHTRYTSCRFKLWTNKGMKKLYEFLAEIGLPLTQCKQKYANMDIQLRANVKEWMTQAAEKYALDRITHVSFIAHFGYRLKFNAVDVVRAVSAILESTSMDKTDSDKFLSALDCLSNPTQVGLGLDMAKLQQMAIFKQVQNLLDTHGIISAGPFVYAVVPDGCPDACYFSHPACLLELCHFMLNAHVSDSKSKKAKNLPLLLLTPYVPFGAGVGEEEEKRSMVVGIPPISEDSPKNFFGKAFEQAAIRVKSLTVHQYFEHSIATMATEDKSKFFDALITLLS